jgi:hypothetical protein
MGRPKKLPEEKRSVQIQLHVSLAEHVELQAAAERAGRSVARAVREAALRAIRADAALAARCCP